MSNSCTSGRRYPSSSSQSRQLRVGFQPNSRTALAQEIPEASGRGTGRLSAKGLTTGEVQAHLAEEVEPVAIPASEGR